MSDLNIRNVPENIHRLMKMAVSSSGMNLRGWVLSAIENEIARTDWPASVAAALGDAGLPQLPSEASEVSGRARLTATVRTRPIPALNANNDHPESLSIQEREIVPDKTPEEEVKSAMKQKKAKRHAELKEDSIAACGDMPDSFRAKLAEPPIGHAPNCSCTRCQVHFRGGR